MILRRVAGDGGVLTQLLSSLTSSIDLVDPVLLGEVTARMEELTELARRVRAEEICAALDEMAPAEPDRP
jgi:transcription termination factor Rho